jgi:hypothetical protein
VTNDNVCAKQDGGKPRSARCANPHCPGRHCAGGEHRDPHRDPLARLFATQTTEARVQTR